MILHRTQSLCPVCLRRIDAVYERTEQEAGVYLRKTCPEHGPFSVPVWLDGLTARSSADSAATAPIFEEWTRAKSPSYPLHPRTESRLGCPFDCGLCPRHAQHTCTGLLEVTMRCNMACPVCYAEAAASGRVLPPDPTLEALALQLDALKKASPGCNVQISGGEPTVREDLPAIIRLVRERHFGLVQVNSNGLRLGQEPDYARSLREAGLDSVYMQFDGVSERTFKQLRGRQCLDFKRRAIEHCAAAGLGVVLVAVVARHVNDAEVGDLLRLALSLGPAVRGLHFQPVSSFGRYPWALPAAPRFTLPELMQALAAQAPELVEAVHFHPPGCEHQLCSFSAAYRRTGPRGQGLQWLPQGGSSCCSSGAATQDQKGEALPTAEEGARKSRQFVALHWRGDDRPAQTERAALADDFSRFISNAGQEHRFTISAMAFQDAYSLDVERVRGCCIHVLQPDGRMVPFCLHNVTAEDGTRLYPGMWGTPS